MHTPFFARHTVGTNSGAQILATEKLEGAHLPTGPILRQVLAAFKKVPDVANILHGHRKIHQGSSGRRTALFSSRKCGGTIPVESRLELRYAVALESDASVLDYRTQAIRLPLSKSRWAIPDFLILKRTGRFEIHEVKPSVDHLSPEVQQKFERIRALLLQEGIGFRVVDDSHLPTERSLEDRLIRYTRGHSTAWTPAQIRLSLSLLNSKVPTSFLKAYKLLAKNDLPPMLADYLSFHDMWVPGQAIESENG